MKVGCDLVRKIRSRGRQRSCGSTIPTGIIPGQYEEKDGDPKVGKDHDQPVICVEIIPGQYEEEDRDPKTGKDHDPPVLQRSYLARMKRRTETPR